jgi:HEAT repeat protein/beta-lactamase regulating signal transducer with metallopeptidase domain
MTAFKTVLAELGPAPAAWLLTYWLHSTLLLGSAWILGRWVLRREAWREVVWKAGLVGGLVTTAVSASGALPSGFRLTVPLAIPAMAGVQGEPHGAALEPAGMEASRPRSGLGEEPTSTPATAEQDADAAAPGAPSGSAVPSSSATPSPSATPLQPAQESTFTLSNGVRASSALANRLAALSGGAPLLILAWLLATSLLLGGLIRRHLRLRRLLRDRRTVSDGPLPSVLAGLRRSTGVWHPVRLSTTTSIATPLALGKGEICVPERFLHALGEEEQKAALAHELGHLVRRDPLWNLGAHVLEAVFFFQPLHRVARVRLRESAEFLADAWAVRETGSRLGLARCLAEVADWVSSVEAPELAGSVAMAEGGSPLLARVRRLLEGEPEAATSNVARGAAAVALVAVTAAFAPTVSSGASALLPTPADPARQHAPPVTQSVEVVRVPATGTLQQRIASAESMAGSSGDRAYWLAYVVEGNVGVREQVSDDTGPGDWLRSGAAVEGLLRVASEVGPAGSGDLLVLVQAAPRAGGSRIVRLAMRSPGLGMDLEGRPVYWLGRARPEESLSWSAGVYEDERQELPIREGALEVVSRHALAKAREILARVARSGAATSVREEAVEGLAYHPADATVQVLAELASSDPNPAVQSEAAETLGEVDNPAAGAALEALVRGSGSSATREEALEALAERGDTLLAGLLLEVALRDPDAEFRIEAVESMEELPADVAIPLLARLLAESRDRAVRIQAVETLGEVGTAEALSVLDRLVDEPDREVALEAVEAIGEFAAELARPRLSRIAREHPVPDVRREALDQLPELADDAAVADVLLEIALSASDPELRREAVEEMEELPSDVATALLGRVVFESRDAGTRRDAAEVLGEVGTAGALQLLDRLARESTDEGLARQAVESIGEYPEDMAGPLLRRIATEHPSVRVRREALNQLGGPQ